jgi:hypothetical protein
VIPVTFARVLPDVPGPGARLAGLNGAAWAIPQAGQGRAWPVGSAFSAGTGAQVGRRGRYRRKAHCVQRRFSTDISPRQTATACRPHKRQSVQNMSISEIYNVMKYSLSHAADIFISRVFFLTDARCLDGFFSISNGEALRSSAHLDSRI